MPAIVATVTWPDVAAGGTGTLKLVALAVVGVVKPTFRLTRSLAGTVSKLVPAIVSALLPSQI